MNKFLVKALVSHEGRPASLRFVPLEIFELWKAHMQNTHDYQVRTVQVSLWVAAGAAEEAASPRDSAPPREAVVSVLLRKKAGTASIPVERFFAEEEIERILPRFLSHYGIRADDPVGMAEVRIQRGFFLRPEEMFEDEG